ncbi:hypothetical protein L249_1223 [Ophiocordyceps polyrhachis-furcata BCC 54312]|uniref:Beta-lactamase-related domain-containing protein n=1 Tax=Ophiocordyceps polyrhachis-furcata BCC 54312 TaxID=1330021 RepID=A0A367LG49_9HYPO|nr:hypothetical protein L249_1223 [Ophiocordyceps polyrhachis-furcata BCC 54312]
MDKLDEILNSHVLAPSSTEQDTRDKLLGAAFIVVDQDGIVYKGAAGRCSLESGAPPFTVSSFTWLASLTKLVTTTCVMQLCERAVLDLDLDVVSLVPELGALKVLRGFDQGGEALLEEHSRTITLRQVILMLLTHTLGSPYVPMIPDLVKWSKRIGRPVRPTDWSIEGLTVPLIFPPGDSWVYGTSLDWAGLVLERVTGQSLGQYMESHIFRPLGMTDTGFWPEKLPQTASRTVAWTRRTPSQTLEPAENFTPAEHEIESGGAGLYSTADDYARFLRGLLQGKLVSEDSLRLMFSPQLTDGQKKAFNDMINQPDLHRAMASEFPLGLELDHSVAGVINLQHVPGKRRKGSLMWSGMLCSHWWIDRETGIAAVLIVNVQDAGDAVVERLYDELERAVYAGRE